MNESLCLKGSIHVFNEIVNNVFTRNANGPGIGENSHGTGLNEAWEISAFWPIPIQRVDECPFQGTAPQNKMAAWRIVDHEPLTIQQRYSNFRDPCREQEKHYHLGIRVEQRGRHWSLTSAGGQQLQRAITSHMAPASAQNHFSPSLCQKTDLTTQSPRAKHPSQTTSREDLSTRWTGRSAESGRPEEGRGGPWFNGRPWREGAEGGGRRSGGGSRRLPKLHTICIPDLRLDWTGVGGKQFHLKNLNYWRMYFHTVRQLFFFNGDLNKIFPSSFSN